MNTPTKYKFLKVDDVIQEGDQCEDGQGNWVPSMSIGRRVTPYNEKEQHYRRLVPAEELGYETLPPFGVLQPGDQRSYEGGEFHPIDPWDEGRVVDTFMPAPVNVFRRPVAAAAPAAVTEPAAVATEVPGGVWSKSGCPSHQWIRVDSGELVVRYQNGDGDERQLDWTDARMRHSGWTLTLPPKPERTEIPGGVWTRHDATPKWVRGEDGMLRFDGYTFPRCGSFVIPDAEMKSDGWTLTLPEAPAAPEPAAQPVVADTVAARCLAEMEARIAQDMAEAEEQNLERREEAKQEYEAKLSDIERDRRDQDCYHTGFCEAMMEMRAALKAAGSPATEAAQ